MKTLLVIAAALLALGCKHSVCDGSVEVPQRREPVSN